MGTVRIWLPPILLVSSVILQSTVMQNFAIKGVIPDISLILLVFFSYQQGSMVGQINGFISGMVQDFLSIAPLGLNAVVRTTVGFLYGLLKGKVFVDPIFLPVVLIILATILKFLCVSLFSAIFIAEETVKAIFGGALWIELGLNAVLAPFLFGLLKMFRVFKVRDSGGFT